VKKNFPLTASKLAMMVEKKYGIGMIKFNREVTSSRFDGVCMLGVAVFCLVLAAIPPYGFLTIWWAVWSVMNFAASRRLYLKIVDAVQPQRHSQIFMRAKHNVAPGRWVNRRNFLWRAPLRGVRRGQHVKK
jgi:hypothetical protein